MSPINRNTVKDQPEPNVQDQPALRIAARRGKLPRNPCELVEPPSGGSLEAKPLTVSEVERILAAADAAGVLAR